MPARISRTGFSTLRSVGVAYSAMKIAESRPSGPATAMAITVISSVPASRGMKPKEAGVPVGDQWVPNRNSMGETARKKAATASQVIAASTPTGQAAASSTP